MRFHIENMTCGHCVRTITRAVQALAPDASVRIDLASKSADIEAPLSTAQIVAAIEGEGYPTTPA